MASKTLLLVLALALIAVAAAASFEQVEVEEDLTDELYGELEEELTLSDLEEYFQPAVVEKRKSKVGPCKRPNGEPCALCNKKIRNKMDMRRYIACESAGKGRKI